MMLVKGVEVRRANRGILFGALRSNQQVDHGVSSIGAGAVPVPFVFHEAEGNTALDDCLQRRSNNRRNVLWRRAFVGAWTAGGAVDPRPENVNRR